MPKDIAILNFNDAKARQMACAFIQHSRGLHRFLCSKLKDQRSLAANAYLWGVVYPHVAAGMSEAWGETITVDDAHEHCRKEFLSCPVVDRNTGEVKMTRIRSTAELDKAEFGEYLDNIIKFAARHLDTPIPAAGEYETAGRSGISPATG